MLNINGKMLARGSLLNLSGQAVPLLVAAITIPAVIRFMGAERFGLLSLAWLILGYFTSFDLGLGRAATKHVAEALARRNGGAVARVVCTVIVAQTLLGLAGALALVLLTPALVKAVLHTPPELQNDAAAMMYVLAAAVPVVLLTASLSGVLEACQRFDLVNAVKAPSASLVYLFTLLGGVAGLSLSAIVALIVLTRMLALSLLAILVLRTISEVRRPAVSLSMLRRLLGFGGWLSVSTVVGPLLVYFDRLMIASLLSLTALAFYTAPYEALIRVSIIPAAITCALYPSFSSLTAGGEHARAANIFARSLKYLLITLCPVILSLLLFAGDILGIWLGPEFAARSALPMRILALGVLANLLAYLPVSYLQGIGRPDIPAKFHLIEVPFYLAICWFCVRQWGIAGAAAAWSVRVAADAALLFAAAARQGACPWNVLSSSRLPATWSALAAFAILGFTSAAAFQGILFRICGFSLALAVFGWAVWSNALDDRDRGMVSNRSYLKLRNTAGAD